MIGPRDPWEDCRDGCGCDMFCAREMALGKDEDTTLEWAPLPPGFRFREAQEENDMGFRVASEGMMPSGFRSKRPQHSGHVITMDGAGTVLNVIGNSPEAEAARIKQAKQRKEKKMATCYPKTDTKKKTTKKQSKTPRVPKLLEIVPPAAEPDVVRLKELTPGEMFRYPAGNPMAIYMVQDLSTAKVPGWASNTRLSVPKDRVSFTALGTGKVFIDDAEKVIIPVLGKLEFEDA